MLRLSIVSLQFENVESWAADPIPVLITEAETPLHKPRKPVVEYKCLRADKNPV